ncbi:MAG: archaeosortase/exosortase family protein [Saprospiraceae bacterium]|nr:archaeosortase/exosortase family protein [Candidatus Defluviibacterium haderslevense]
MGQNKSSITLEGVQEVFTKNKMLAYYIGVGLFILVYYLFSTTQIYNQYIQFPVAKLFSFISAQILNFFGFPTVIDDNQLTTGVSSISIAKGCDAIAVMIIYTASVIMLPNSSMKNKMQGIWIGLAVLMFANIIRILSLVFCNIYRPELFEFLHIEFWQIIFIFLGASMFLIWLNKYAYASK